jgi:hypothetical protein
MGRGGEVFTSKTKKYSLVFCFLDLKEILKGSSIRISIGKLDRFWDSICTVQE